MLARSLAHLLTLHVRAYARELSRFLADGGRAAVFDGATESFAARRWARLVSSCWEQDAEDFMGRAQAEYALGASDRALSWAQEEASQRGSFTTIAAIQTVPGGLRTTIVGDSSVLFLNRDEIVESFPYATAEEFGSTPLALGSESASLGPCYPLSVRARHGGAAAAAPSRRQVCSSWPAHDALGTGRWCTAWAGLGFGRITASPGGAPALAAPWQASEGSRGARPETLRRAVRLREAGPQAWWHFAGWLPGRV